MKLTPKNIRIRLIAWYIFSLGVVHLLVGTALYQMIAARLYHEFDARLQTYTSCLVEVLPQHRQLELASVVKEMTEVAALGSDVYVHVADQHDQVIYESAGVSPAIATRLRTGAGLSRGQPVTLPAPGSGRWRVIKRHVHENGKRMYTGVVAIPLQGVQQALVRLQFILIVVVPCILILASFGAWRLLNRALSPLREVIQTAQAIQAKDLSQRLRVPATGDEVQALAETFNEMIARIHRSFEQMRRFISDASHELRTPLTILRGEVELELKNHPLSDRCQETLATCAGEISRMSRLVETLLFLSNADAERIVLDLKPIVLMRLLEGMAEETRVLAEAKHLHLEVVNGSDVVVRADEMRLKQLLLNLLDNAVKYTPPGGRITLGCQVEGEAAMMTVADTGIGIEAEDLSRIFDRFYRADSSRSHAAGGYGLGLAICKWIAEAHRGTIRVKSLPGRGSAFTVSLPLA